MKPLQFYHLLVMLNGAIPLALTVADSWLGTRDVRTYAYAMHFTGVLSIVFLLMSLLVTMVSRRTSTKTGTELGFALGMFGFVYSMMYLFVYFSTGLEDAIASVFQSIPWQRTIGLVMAAIIVCVPLVVMAIRRLIERHEHKRCVILKNAPRAVAALIMVHFITLQFIPM